jgi:endonuclease YncB( thermonuclease family)
MTTLATSKLWQLAADTYAGGGSFPLTSQPAERPRPRAGLLLADVALTVPVPFQLNAVLAQVTDGDTVKVTVDWGKRRNDVDQPIRLLGCAARERSEPGGPEATAHVAELLPAGTALVLTTVKDDKFAPRWDCQVAYVAGDGHVHDLAADLIAGWWAAPWDGRGAQPKPPWPRPS